MKVTSQAEDSASAARLMRRMDVAAIVVLGGDGTHRVVVSECGNVPIAGVSTGTNNAFPDHRRADDYRAGRRPRRHRRRAARPLSSTTSVSK